MKFIDNSIILLTACINPEGMIYTKLVDSVERRKQYIEAITYYINKTQHNIVFCCNSGYDIIADYFSSFSNRIEFLFYDGNDYDKSLGKGYGEFDIIKYALQHSSYLKEAKTIIKITGRLIISNLDNSIRKSIIYAPPHHHIRTKTSFNEVFCFIDYFSINATMADSRCICAPKSFFDDFCRQVNDINDSNHFYFEHKLLKFITLSQFPTLPFCLPLLFEGVSGSTLEKYDSSLNRMESEYIQNYIRRQKNEFHIKIGILNSFVVFVLRLINLIKRSLHSVPSL